MKLDAAYQVLEVDSRVSNEAVSKAYRRQLSKHHPDKLKANGLPESMLEHAKQRTQQIIEAYELITGSSFDSSSGSGRIFAISFGSVRYWIARRSTPKFHGRPPTICAVPFGENGTL